VLGSSLAWQSNCWYFAADPTNITFYAKPFDLLAAAVSRWSRQKSNSSRITRQLRALWSIQPHRCFGVLAIDVLPCIRIWVIAWFQLGSCGLSLEFAMFSLVRVRNDVKFAVAVHVKWLQHAEVYGCLNSRDACIPSIGCTKPRQTKPVPPRFKSNS